MVDTLITVAATLVGVVLTLIFTNRREESRLRQERFLEESRLRQERFFKFREDKKQLYVALVKETEYLDLEGKHSERMADLFNEIQLLTEDENLILAASRLRGAWTIASIKQSEQLEDERVGMFDTTAGADTVLRLAEELHECRTRFIQIARRELGLSADLDAIKTERESQEAAEPRSWWRRMFGG